MGRVGEGDQWMWLDFSSGASVMITDRNNMAGCKQPAYKHLGSRHPVYNVERKDIIFAPGDLGVDIDDDGTVCRIHAGPAKEKGVQTQWIIRKIIAGGVNKR